MNQFQNLKFTLKYTSYIREDKVQIIQSEYTFQVQL